MMTKDVVKTNRLETLEVWGGRSSLEAAFHLTLPALLLSCGVVGFCDVFVSAHVSRVVATTQKREAVRSAAEEHSRAHSQERAFTSSLRHILFRPRGAVLSC